MCNDQSWLPATGGTDTTPPVKPRRPFKFISLKPQLIYDKDFFTWLISAKQDEVLFGSVAKRRVESKVFITF